MRVIQDVAGELGIATNALMVYNDQLEKLRLFCLPAPDTSPPGKIILVSAINPTRAGEDLAAKMAQSENAGRGNFSQESP